MAQTFNYEYDKEGQLTNVQITDTGFVGASIVYDYDAIGNRENVDTDPLPVELVYFTAILIDGSYVQLDWQTASELNNDHFIVQKSYDGLDWQFLERVEGNGTTLALNDYQSFDMHPQKGYNYYRLKQVDFNGTSTYTEVREVFLPTKPLRKLLVVPNPTNGRVSYCCVDGLESITVRTLDGRLLLNTYTDEATGSINLTNLEKGVLILSFKSKYAVQTVKLIKL